MPRIRTIKPEYFRHEALQDLEAANIGSCCMLVFQGLWTQCDNQGIFPYQPRQLKLDILPFLKFDMKKTLFLLEKAGFIYSYFVNDKQYGIIPSLPEHQRFSGKEAGQEGKRFPPPPNNGEALVKQQGSNREAIVKDQSFTNVQEKEKEKEKEKERNNYTMSGKPDAPALKKPDSKKISTSNSIPFAAIIGYLNQTTGKNYKPDSKEALKHIKARWLQGFVFNDFVKVIDTKVAKWRGDPKMDDFLRPETLFSPKFESYLNEAREPPVRVVSDCTKRNLATMQSWLEKSEGEAHEEQKIVS